MKILSGRFWRRSEMEKNFVEKVTNLEREKVKYVPKKIFDEVITRLDLMSGDDIETGYQGDPENVEFIKTKLKEAKESTKEFYTIETNNKKPDISICPYCGGKMLLTFWNGNRSSVSYSRNRVRTHEDDSIQYKCCYCGATSPNVYIKISLMNEAEVKKDIQKEIEFAMKEVKIEEEGEYDD
jgi:DNA-directed RNA polymerase subunit RPC12/RpoP